MMALVGDLAIYAIQGKSILNLKHSFKNTMVWFIAWPVGAFVVGYVGQVVKVFQVTMVACAAVGFLWPILLVMILEKLQKPADIQQSTDEDEQ